MNSIVSTFLSRKRLFKKTPLYSFPCKINKMIENHALDL